MNHPVQQIKAFHPVLLAALLAFDFGAVRSQAAILTWTGGAAPNGSWQQANNWGGPVPNPNDSLIFAGNIQILSTNTFPAGLILNNLQFDISADAFTLAGNSFTLTTYTNGTDGSTVNPLGGNITNSAGVAETMLLPMTLSPGRHSIVTLGGGQLNLNGLVTRSVGATAVFIPGAGNINVFGGLSTNGLNNILGAGMTLGSDWATLDPSGNIVAFAGYTDIATGTIANDPTSNVRYISDTGNITAPNGTRINSILTQQGAARSITNAGTTKLGSKGGIYRLGTGVITVTGGIMVADGGGELTFSDSPFNATGGNNLNLVSVISNDGPNVVSVNIMGYVQFGQAVAVKNTYSGGTYINQGRVQITPTNGFGSGPVFVFPGAQILFNSDGTYTNDFFIGGVGSAESGGLGAFRMGGANRIIAGKVTLMGDAVIANNGQIRGPISGSGNLFIGHGTTANGHGVIVVGGPVASDYTGDTIIASANQAADTLRMNSGFNNILPHGAGKGNMILNAGSATITATLDLNGSTQTINALTNTANSPANNFVTSVGAATLILGDSDATSTFAGRIQNSVSVTKIGAGTQSFTGANSYTNATTVNGGTLFFDVGSFPSATTPVSANSGGLLDLSQVTPVTLFSTLSMSNGTAKVSLPPGGAAITTPSLVALGTSNFISVASIPAISTYPAVFTAIKYTSLAGSLNFALGSLPSSPGTPFAAYVSNNVANSSVDVVITAGPTSLKWRGFAGGVPNSAWDIGSTLNWVTFAGGTTTYSDGSFVQFDDTASNNVATLQQDVSPAGLTLTNNSLTYTLNGGGKIGGGGGITKQGSGTAIIDNTGPNDFGGNVSIFAGALQFGNSDSAGTLPADAGVLDNGTLIFNRNDIVTVSNIITGTGSVAHNGSSTLVLSSANAFNGMVTIVSGATLQLGNSGALGTTNNGTIVNSGGTLDFGNNAVNIGAEPVTASGSGVGGLGAIVNNSGSATFVAQNFTRLTLANDTTIGGSGRLDLRSNPTSNPLLASLLTGGQPYKLTKIGANQFSIVGVTVDSALGDIEVQAGTLSVETATTSLGNPANSLTVFSGAELHTFAPTNLLNKHFVINDGGVVNNTSGNTTIIGPMLLTNSSLSPNPYCTFNIGGTSMTMSNVLTGDAILYKVTGVNPLFLNGTSPDFAGGAYINAGTLVLNGTLSNNLGIYVNAGKFTVNGTLLGAGVTNTFGGILAGSGSATGTADASGLILPGETNVVGTLTVGTLILEPSATLVFDLTSINTPGSGSNDLVNVNGDLVVNGNSITINPIGLLLIGASTPYRLFNYTGNLIWNSDLNVTGPNGYLFTVNTNTPGQVNIVASGGPPVWNGGSATDANWSDSANWNGIAIGPGSPLFFAGNTRVNNTNDTAAGTSYGTLAFNTGAGAFVLNGNPITMGGNIVNFSSGTQTVDLGLTFNANVSLDGGVGLLVIGGGLTNAANTTLTLSGSGVISNLFGAVDPTTMTNIINVNSNSSWTVLDNPSAAPITAPVQFDVQGGTVTFGSAGSAPNLTSSAAANNSRLGIAAGAPATLNMVNGTLSIAARLNTGVAANTLATINQTGGTLNPQALLQVSDGSPSAYTTINVTGGLLTVGDAGGLNNLFLASRGTGIVTIATSGVINCATLDMSRNAAGNTLGSVGVVNLNSGGTLAVNRVGAATSASQAGGTPTATFNFNGGTLKANVSAANFFQGNAASPTIPIAAIVKAGGAIIDSTNVNITFSESLQHDASLGGTPDGGLRKLGVGTLTIAANSTYTGPTIVTNGTLTANATLATTAVAVATNGTLSGTGTAGTSVTVNAGGTLAPAAINTIGTLTVGGNVTLQAGSSNVMELNHTSATSDQVRATASTATTITYGGTLVLTNLSGTLTGSDTFKLFSATNYAGAFSALSPAIPQAGLAWNTNTLTTDGILRFTVTVNTNPTNLTAVLSNNVVVVSWPSDHTGWRLQVQTNSVSVGVGNNWVDVPNSGFVNSVNFPLDPNNGSVFFRMIFP